MWHLTHLLLSQSCQLFLHKFLSVHPDKKCRTDPRQRQGRQVRVELVCITDNKKNATPCSVGSGWELKAGSDLATTGTQTYPACT